jgi:hypothetical protein
MTHAQSHTQGTAKRAREQRLNHATQELGYQLLLLKRIMHIDSFRFTHPRVHPSGFSASAD